MSAAEHHPEEETFMGAELAAFAVPASHREPLWTLAAAASLAPEDMSNHKNNGSLKCMPLLMSSSLSSSTATSSYRHDDCLPSSTFSNEPNEASDVDLALGALPALPSVSTSTESILTAAMGVLENDATIQERKHQTELLAPSVRSDARNVGDDGRSDARNVGDDGSISSADIRLLKRAQIVDIESSTQSNVRSSMNTSPMLHPGLVQMEEILLLQRNRQLASEHHHQNNKKRRCVVEEVLSQQFSSQPNQRQSQQQGVCSYAQQEQEQMKIQASLPPPASLCYGRVASTEDPSLVQLVAKYLVGIPGIKFQETIALSPEQLSHLASIMKNVTATPGQKLQDCPREQSQHYQQLSLTDSVNAITSDDLSRCWRVLVAFQQELNIARRRIIELEATLARLMQEHEQVLRDRQLERQLLGQELEHSREITERTLRNFLLATSTIVDDTVTGAGSTGSNATVAAASTAAASNGCSYLPAA